MNRQPTLLLLIALLASGIVYCLHELITLAIAHWQMPSLNGDSFTFIIRGHGKTISEWIINQHNEHRIIPAKIASIIETEFFKIPPGQSGIFQNIALILASIGQWCWLCHRELKRADLRIVTALGGSLILLNPWQYENLRWEFQTPWFLINALVLTCALILSRPQKAVLNSRLSLFLAPIIPWIALGSTGQGLALALAFIGCAFITNPRFGAVVSISTGIAAATFYAILPYSKPNQHPDLSFQLDYFIRALLGGEWQGLALICIVFTAVLLGRRQIPPRHHLPTILMPGLFSIIFAGMITLSRSGFGVDQANESRYITHSLMLGLSLMMALSVADDQNERHASPLLGGFLILISVLGSFPQSLNSGTMTFSEAWHKAHQGAESKRKGLACHARKSSFAKHGIELIENCERIFPREGVADRYLEGGWPVKPLGWHKELLLKSYSFKPGTIRHHIDNTKLTSTDLDINGWAFLKQANKQRLYIFADYSYSKQIAFPVSQSREDVKKIHQITNRKVGFDVSIPRDIEGKQLLAVRLGTPNNNVLIWEKRNNDG